MDMAGYAAGFAIGFGTGIAVGMSSGGDDMKKKIKALIEKREISILSKSGEVISLDQLVALTKK